MRQFLPCATLISILCIISEAFHTPICYSSQTNIFQRSPSSQLCATQQHDRREAFRKVGQIFGVIASVNLLQTDESVSHAADAVKEPTIWKSGKTPIVAGAKPKDKNDTNGTRKDSSFLRGISNCKSQCEGSNGPDGFARSKEECLSDCQDICCSTYEQCTFGIVPRI
mmetsp:Transcript_2646/g.2521  ORF Transcript_2646/g.2521 Transcript_2646/m.2521 type:complete len:168 (+) Transcript_2646:16-519(+)